MYLQVKAVSPYGSPAFVGSYFDNHLQSWMASGECVFFDLLLEFGFGFCFAFGYCLMTLLPSATRVSPMSCSPWLPSLSYLDSEPPQSYFQDCHALSISLLGIGLLSSSSPSNLILFIRYLRIVCPCRASDWRRVVALFSTLVIGAIFMSI